MICNILATQVERTILDDLIKTGAVVDLVVVTLLRINSTRTKEVLGKSLFNLLARADFRSEMLLRQDLLSAMLELTKIDSLELLDLCIRAVHNISCETNTYADKIGNLHIPAWLITKLTFNGDSLTGLNVSLM